MNSEIESIKAWMKKKNMTQAQLAARLHCGLSTLNRILNGKDALRPAFYARIKEVMSESKDTISVTLPDDLSETITRLAALDGVSPNEWIMQRVKQYTQDLRAIVQDKGKP